MSNESDNKKDENETKVVPFKAPDERPLTAAERKEATLRRKAKPEYIAHRLGNVLRHLMRAVAVQSDHSMNLFHAEGSWKFMLELMERCEEPLSWYDLFDQAVKGLRDDGGPELSALNEAYREVARRRQGPRRLCISQRQQVYGGPSTSSGASRLAAKRAGTRGSAKDPGYHLEEPKPTG